MQPASTHWRRIEHPLVRWLGALGAAAALAALVLAFAPSSPQQRATRARALALPPGHDLLMSVLDRLRRALLPDERTRLLAAMAETTPSLTAPILWVLARPAHERFGETAALAADLQIGEAIDPLATALAGAAPTARAAALVALERLQPLGDMELQDALDDPDAPLARAVLAILAARGGPSAAVLPRVLALLRHADAGVRDAAFKLLPMELPAECLDVLLDLCEDRVAGAMAVRLLDRVPPTPSSVQRLVEHLGSADADAQTGLLATIDHYAAAEPVRRLLWELASGDGPVPPRAAALCALERVQAETPLPGDIARWPATLRYHVARLRIRTGHLDGIDLLLDLLGHEDDAAEIGGGARLVLSRLARIAPHSGLQTFTDWRAGLTEVPSYELPPARPGN